MCWMSAFYWSVYYLFWHACNDHTFFWQLGSPGLNETAIVDETASLYNDHKTLWMYFRKKHLNRMTDFKRGHILQFIKKRHFSKFCIEFWILKICKRTEFRFSRLISKVTLHINKGFDKGFFIWNTVFP